MKEKIFSLLLAMIMLMPAKAQEVVDRGWSLNNSTGELRIWKDFEDFTDNSKDAWLASKDLIKSVVIENGVTKIADNSFSVCRNLTSVVIPNSVMSIGNYAFYFCSGLKSVVIPNSVTSIGDYAFCSSGLTSVVIPNSVTSIGREAICACTGLTSIKVAEGNVKYDSRGNCNAIIETSTNSLICGCKTTLIPNNVMGIGNSAFVSCRGLTSVVIPNSVTSIGSGAFSKCSGLTSVVIPNSVTSIGNDAFNDCSGLVSVVIPNSVTIIGAEAFSGCSSLTSVVIPNSVTIIGNGAFYECSSLMSVAIADGVKTIGSYAFYNCNNLMYVEIPNSVISIANLAFYNCSSLTSVEIHNGVEKIGINTFLGCSGLKTIYTDKEDPTILKSALGTSRTFIVPCSFTDEQVVKYISAGLTVSRKSHVFTNYTYDNNATTQADGTETAVCDRDGCEVTDTRTAEGTKHAGTPTSVKNMGAGHSHKVRKVVVNGRLMIEKDGEMYDLAGQKM